MRVSQRTSRALFLSPEYQGKRVEHRGYVLVVTLGLLVLAASLMVSVGRASLRHAVEAREAGEDLQRRWGTVSCRGAVLPFAENILVSAEAQARKPVPVLRASVRLGEQSFDLIVSDEQAKANVNAMIADTDVREAQQRMVSAMSGTGLISEVRLRVATAAAAKPASRPAATPVPATSPASATRPATAATAAPAAALPRVVSGYGQIFDGVRPQRLVGSMGITEPAAAELLTCWGDGKINVRRARENVLRLAASPPLTGMQITRLLDARNNALRGRGTGKGVTGAGPRPEASTNVAASTGNGAPASPLLAAAGIAPAGAASRLTESSQCHSIWVITRTKQRDYHYFSVLETPEASKPIASSAVW